LAHGTRKSTMSATSKPGPETKAKMVFMTLGKRLHALSGQISSNEGDTG